MNQTATDHTLDSHNWLSTAAFKLLTCYFCLLFLASPACAFDHSHKLFTSELKKYARPDGVRYAKWKEHPEGLLKYLESLKNLSQEEYDRFTADERKALWLNAYNALAVKLVMDHYPIKGTSEYYPSSSIRQIPNCWDAIKWSIAEKEVTLYTIAHDILRRERDGRTHFGIVPATKGGGNLQSKAFQAKTLDDQLNQVTAQYLSRPENLHCDFVLFTITVSGIFKWFPLDFISCTPDGRVPMPPPKDDDIVRSYVEKFLPADVRTRLKGKEMKIIYAPYDWSLNDAGVKSLN